MVATLESFHFHVIDGRAGPAAATHSSGPDEAGLDEAGPERGAGDETEGPRFSSNEAAARYYLDDLLQRDGRPAMRAIVGAVVELTGERELVSVNAELDEVSGVDAVESLSRAATYFGGSTERDAKIAAIREAYRLVGIG